MGAYVYKHIHSLYNVHIIFFNKYLKYFKHVSFETKNLPALS